MTRPMMLALSAALLLALGVASGVSAHGHQVCTPGAGDPLIAPEPFHGDDPSGGAILTNPHVSETAYEAWGLHPIHHFLHIGPSADTRGITVVRTDTASCP